MHRDVPSGQKAYQKRKMSKLPKINTQRSDSSIREHSALTVTRIGSTKNAIWPCAPIGREDQAVDDVAGIERVQALALRKVPQHGHAVLKTGTRGGRREGRASAGCRDIFMCMARARARALARSYAAIIVHPSDDHSMQARGFCML